MLVSERVLIPGGQSVGIQMSVKLSPDRGVWRRIRALRQET